MIVKLNIIIGSTRPGRVSPKIAKWVEAAAREHGKFEVELIDLVDFNLPLLDEAAHPRMQKYEHEHSKKWSASVQAADAFVFVTPEYDYFPPAALINAIQALSLEWGYKPAGVVSYGGISGGLRSAQELRTLLGNLNAHAIPQVVPVPLFPKFISEDGVFTPNDEMNAGAKGMLDELFKWAGPLATIRSAS
ncbi:MAG: NADPH-dependent FMN reductase [Martelella sp.]|uniref:NADPH-dependent FMN reductase n=1 Tax=unclassified Martelella TaxID=2629616 RepID=UPI000C4B7A69|nr:NADPH-dependent FMN reductase [Martelella sp.]MAU21511.1 NADPH-dependent FMN reductase [Martelella sp.]